MGIRERRGAVGGREVGRQESDSKQEAALAENQMDR